jgi:hypothetical protein
MSKKLTLRLDDELGSDTEAIGGVWLQAWGFAGTRAVSWAAGAHGTLVA